MKVDIPELVKVLLTKCRNCESAEECDKYDKENEDRYCPYEINIFKENYEDLVENKNVDKERFKKEIIEICTLKIRLWRRRFFESTHSLSVTDASRISSQENKISNTLNKLEKSLGIDRFTHLKNVESLPEVKEERNLSTVFNQINNIFIGASKIEDKEVEKKLKNRAQNRIKQLTLPDVKESVEIEFDDLKFDEFGVKVLPYEASKTKEEMAEEDMEKMPLVDPDTKDERYIPVRQ